VPVSVNGREMDPHFDMAICKTKIEMRDEADITDKSDPDAVVLK
jgi:hypothetical protein